MTNTKEKIMWFVCLLIILTVFLFNINISLNFYRTSGKSIQITLQGNIICCVLFSGIQS